MFDQRNNNIIELSNSECLKDKTTYKFIDSVTGKKLIAKLISDYEDANDSYLIQEFRKLALLSGEPEIATVYNLSKSSISGNIQNCYVMDFIEGKTLGKFLSSSEFYNYEVLLEILIQISSGLEKAHNYEVFHGDLHNENIIINKFGYVKIIDFHWFDFDKQDTNLKRDLAHFKRISSEFYNKCKSFDKKRYKLIDDCSQKSKTLNGLKKELILIDEFNFDYGLLNEKSLKILAILFKLSNTYDLIKVINIKEGDIPDDLIPKLSENEKQYIEKNKLKPKLMYKDEHRIKFIHKTLFTKFDFVFHILKQSNILNWEISIQNQGDVFTGPYIYNCEISVTSKFYKWKKINELIGYLDDSDCDLDATIFE